MRVPGRQTVIPLSLCDLLTHLIPHGSTFLSLSSALSLTNVTVQGFMPAASFCNPTCVVRLAYYAHGENETALEFFQCADIAIQAQADETTPAKISPIKEAEKKAARKHVPSASDPTGCCTVPAWEAQFMSSSMSSGGSGALSWDYSNGLVRSVLLTNFGSDAEVHYVNYTAMVEFRFVQTGAQTTCTAYGIDEFAPWCVDFKQNTNKNEST
jgi:hypothetical protein